MARGPEAANPVKDVKQEICGKKRERTPDPDDVGETVQIDAGHRDGSAVLKPGRPDWRVPRISPSPRRRRSSSANRKPSSLSRRIDSRALAVSPLSLIHI